MANVLLGLLFDVSQEVLHDALVKVRTSQVRVAIGSQHLEYPLVNGEERDIEGAASEIKDQYILLAARIIGFVHAIGNRGGGGFVDDSLNMQPSNDTGVPRGMTLSIIEVGRHRHDGPID
mmetsp:Transcript_20426/g.48236  ORF Transcript_20426/g.48236 Transcript_20426/m.48236 type:complete len:120 (-) Transcript_20426:268-627(-)